MSKNIKEQAAFIRTLALGEIAESGDQEALETFLDYEKKLKDLILKANNNGHREVMSLLLSIETMLID